MRLIGALLSTLVAISECRELKDKRIVGGEDAQQGRYMWMADIELIKDEHWCGGSLIDKRGVVLTAGHCFFLNGDVHVPHRVIFGQADRSASKTDVRENIRVARVIMHEGYDDNTLENDIALLILEDSSENEPVYLPDSDEYTDSGDDLMVIGWGALAKNGIYPDHLQQVELEAISQSECTEFDDINPGDLFSYNMCAYTEGKDSCQGDSGGPLFHAKEDDDDKDVQVGIVSWGIGCASSPGVYMKVFDYLDWIEENINEAIGTHRPTRGPTSRPSASERPTSAPISTPTTVRPTTSRPITSEPTTSRPTTSEPTSFPTSGTGQPSPLPTISPTLRPTSTSRPSIGSTTRPSRTPSISPSYEVYSSMDDEDYGTTYEATEE